MKEKRLYAAVMIVQLIYATTFQVAKAAFNDGMNPFIFVFYKQASASILISPFAFFESKKAPKLPFKTLCHIFMLSLLGMAAALDLNCLALRYTSANLAAATLNCIPVITFLFALLFRMEKVKVRSKGGMGKIGGLVLTVVGAGTLAFYKGPYLNLFHHQHHHLFLSSSKEKGSEITLHSNYNLHWIKGCLIMLSSNIIWALWLVLQVVVLKRYPFKLLVTTLQFMFSAVQCFVIAFGLEREVGQWRLGLDVRLLAVVYTAVMVNGVVYYLQNWVIIEKGPVFFTMWTPLSFILTLLLSPIFLDETITLGSVLSGILLVGGLYSLMWGKMVESKRGEEKEEITQEENERGESTQIRSV